MKYGFLIFLIFIQITIQFVTSRRLYNPKHSNNSCINRYQKKLINLLKNDKIIVSKAVEDVMCSIDRGDFAPRHEAYENQPAYIKYGATLSLPGAHARALEVMYKKYNGRKNLEILDIGSGSGYLTLAFAKLFKDSKVYGIEHIKALTKQSVKNIKKHNSSYMKNIVLLTADGRKGMPNHKGGFDIIHSGASTQKKPTDIINQLKSGGRLFIPVKDTPDFQHIHIYDKNTDGTVHDKKDFQENYVKLQSAKKQLKLGKAGIYYIPKKIDEKETLRRSHSRRYRRFR